MLPTTTPRYVRLSWVDPGTGHDLERLVQLPVTLGRAIENTIPLNSRSVSRQHAQIEQAADGEVVLADRHSSNGTFLGGQRITRAVLREGANFQIGPFVFSVSFLSSTQAQATSMLAGAQGVPVSASPGQDEATVIFPNTASAPLLLTPPASAEEVFPPVSFQQPFVSVQHLRNTRLPLTETTYLAIGGGLGSFAWIDHLRIAGVPPEQIICISPEPKPHSRFARLCHNSQIPLHERVRSHSEACPDNLWGFPSYGMREIWRSARGGQLRHALHVAGQLLSEPVIADTYTPRAGDVFASLDREAARIGWERMRRPGLARAIRKTDDGRYVVALTRTDVPTEQRHQFMIARYIHLCVGYPGIQLLSDLQGYRERTRDFKKAINAYEYHEHVYQHLLQYGGIVMVRGRGIVASRVIQRLYEVRQHNPNVSILHLMRAPALQKGRPGNFWRQAENHWEFKPFGWPKSCWGGVYLIKMEKANDQTRDQFINDWGGTTTARRRDWRQMVRIGLREGWYHIGFGNVKRLERTPSWQMATLIQSAQPGHPESRLVTDFVIDCTGLEQSLDYHTLLYDLVTHHRLVRNPKGRLKVANDFEVLGMENGNGRIYAAGIMTLGGPHAAQDSFLGLQYAALRSVETLAALHAQGVHHISGLYSFKQWTRWVRGVHP